MDRCIELYFAQTLSIALLHKLIRRQCFLLFCCQSFSLTILFTSLVVVEIFSLFSFKISGNFYRWLENIEIYGKAIRGLASSRKCFCSQSDWNNMWRDSAVYCANRSQSSYVGIIWPELFQITITQRVQDSFTVKGYVCQ